MVSLAMLAPLFGVGADASGQKSDVVVLPKVEVSAGPTEEFCLKGPLSGPAWLHFMAMSRRPEMEGTKVSRFTFPASAHLKDKDMIVSINGRPIETLEPSEGTRLLVQPAGTVIALELASAESKKTRRLDLVVRAFTPGPPSRVAFAMVPVAGASPAAK